MLKICLIILGSIIVLLSIIYMLVKLSKGSKKKTCGEYFGLLEALGNVNNITEVALNGSRISAKFIDKELINKELIKENGVESIVISNKKITLVIGKSSNDIFEPTYNDSEFFLLIVISHKFIWDG